MSPGVPDHVIDRIARGVDFVSLVNRYSKVQRRGNRHWALCPFHNEKTPSFSIDAEQGLFYCFGCKEGGNVFTFLQKVEGLDFGQALEKLAAEAGIDLKEHAGDWGKAQARGQKLRQVNELAVAYYQKCREKGKGGGCATTYLEERGIDAESIEKWRLGYAPDGWDYFLKFAQGRQYEPEVLSKAGLVKARKSGTGYIDRFRNRLMFPIEDRLGRAIGFGARALDDDDQPKYLNSPETPLFSKGRCFYGLAQARDAIRSEKTAVVVEGYTDVIMCHQFGFTNVLGVLGTALTADHASTLGRLCDNVILVFDADEAGQKSAKRSIEVLLAEDLDVSVASLPEDMDPCDLLVNEGKAAFENVLEDDEDFLDFGLRLAGQENDLDSVKGRTAAFREVAELAVSTDDAARRDMIVRQLADRLGIGLSGVWRSIIDQYSSSRRGRGRREEDPEAEQNEPRLAVSQYACDLLGFLLQNTEFQEEASQKVKLDLLEDSEETEALQHLLDICEKNGEMDSQQFINLLKEPTESSLVASVLVREEKVQETTERTPEERFDLYMSFFEQKQREREIQQLSPKRMAASRAGGDPESEGQSDSSEDGALDDERLKAYYERLKERDRNKQP